MNYFLDTNVGLGHVFCTDPWNSKAEPLFNEKDTFYISYCVRKEFDKKYNHILKKQMNFLYSLTKELEKLKWDFDDNLKEEIVEVLRKRCKNKHEFNSQSKEYVCTVKDLLIYIKKFIRGFKRKLIDNENCQVECSIFLFKHLFYA